MGETEKIVMRGILGQKYASRVPGEHALHKEQVQTNSLDFKIWKLEKAWRFLL